MITIIIPILNEEKILSENCKGFQELSRCAELIFVDGGSTDKSKELAAECGKVLDSARGRAVQMNRGAREAGCDIFLFLHADNIISSDVLLEIGPAMFVNEFAVGGCLTQRIDSPRRIFRFIEAQGNIRARLSKVFYGDQGIFVRKNVFTHLGGFPEVPVFEDVLFSEKLSKVGETVVLPYEVLVSARRWEQRGVLRTILLYTRLWLMFKRGVPLERIKKAYEDLR